MKGLPRAKAGLVCRSFGAESSGKVFGGGGGAKLALYKDRKLKIQEGTLRTCSRGATGVEFLCYITFCFGGSLNYTAPGQSQTGHPPASVSQELVFKCVLPCLLDLKFYFDEVGS